MSPAVEAVAKWAIIYVPSLSYTLALTKCKSLNIILGHCKTKSLGCEHIAQHLFVTLFKHVNAFRISMKMSGSVLIVITSQFQNMFTHCKAFYTREHVYSGQGV